MSNMYRFEKCYTALKGYSWNIMLLIIDKLLIILIII